MSFTLSFTRGDDRTLTITVTDEDGSPYPLTGRTVWFTAKRDVRDPDEDAVIQKTNIGAGGVEVLDPDHTARVHLDALDTAMLSSRATELYCDVQILADGKVFTAAVGTITVTPDVTRASG